MQNITIDGYLSKDAEQRQAGGGNVTTWNVPVRQGFGDKEQTNWFRVSIWGKRADFASKAVKGDFIVATGALTIGEYNGKPQYEVNAADFTLRSAAPRDASARTPDGSRGAPIQSQGYVDDLDDSIPFIAVGTW